MTLKTSAAQAFLRRSLAAGALALVMATGLAASVLPAEAYHRHGFMHRRYFHPFHPHRFYHPLRRHRFFHHR